MSADPTSTFDFNDVPSMRSLFRVIAQKCQGVRISRTNYKLSDKLNYMNT